MSDLREQLEKLTTIVGYPPGTFLALDRQGVTVTAYSAGAERPLLDKEQIDKIIPVVTAALAEHDAQVRADAINVVIAEVERGAVESEQGQRMQEFICKEVGEWQEVNLKLKEERIAEIAKLKAALAEEVRARMLEQISEYRRLHRQLFEEDWGELPNTLKTPLPDVPDEDEVNLDGAGIFRRHRTWIVRMQYGGVSARDFHSKGVAKEFLKLVGEVLS